LSLCVAWLGGGRWEADNDSRERIHPRGVIVAVTISKISSAAARVVPPPKPKKVVAPAPVKPAKPVKAAAPVVAKVKAAIAAPAKAVASKLSAATTSPVYTAAGAQSSAPAATENPLSFVTKGGEVSVDILSSDSGYENKIYWSDDNFATRHYLGIDNQIGSVTLGAFAAGTRIEFGIENGVGQFFRAGPGSSNSDGFEHAQVTQTSVGMHVGFEDLWGGGDRDFNDVIISVREAPTQQAPVKGATTPPSNSPVVSLPATPAPVSTVPEPSNAKEKESKSRSGLADGTNPGQGAGRENSPNMGTLNPNNAKKTTSKTTAAKPITTKKK
jgi:hypothetical protein